MIEDNIKVLYRNDYPLDNYETVIRGSSGEVYVLEDDLNFGDKLTLVTENQDNSMTSYRESVFLSTVNKRLYKNLVIEADIQFIQDSSKPKQWVEFIVRGVSRYNTTYSIDECYLFGYKDGDFYFGKRGFHEEGSRSYAYKQLFDLTSVGDDIRKYYTTFTDEQKNKLQLESDVLDYNQRYIFRCEIFDDYASFKIKNVSKKINQTQSYEWITLFEGVNIRQTIDDITNVTLDLQNSVSVFEPFSVIEESGFYGFTVPNTHVKIHRFLIESKDPRQLSDLYDSEQFSREISSEFSMQFNNFKPIKLNSVVPGKENKEVLKEHENIQGNRVIVEYPLNKDEIKSIELNDITVNKNEIFVDKKLEIIHPLSNIHIGNKLTVIVDQDKKDHFKQQELFFDFDTETDGVSTTYDIPSEVYDIIGKFPNAKIDDILVEIDSNVVSNDVDRVGVKEDFDKFIDKNKLIQLYSGRKFYVETDIRGVNKTIEMGTVTQNRFTFDIHEFYLNTSPSYDAVWNYNLANFINEVLDEYAGFITKGGPGTAFGGDTAYTINLALSGDPLYNYSDLAQQADFIRNVLFDKYGVSIGKAVADIPEDLFNYLVEAQPRSNFVVSDTEFDPIIKKYLKLGVDQNAVKVFCEFIRIVTLPYMKELVVYGKQKNTLFEDFLEQFINSFGATSYRSYSEFRKIWLRDRQFNMIISDSGVTNRLFFKSLKEDEFIIQDKKIKFNYIPKIGKKIKLRVFYDFTFDLTNSYQQNVSVYELPENIKTLYSETKGDKGVDEIVEYINNESIYTTVKNNIPFVVIPKDQNYFNDELYLDVSVCVPYATNSDTVHKFAKIPLKKVDSLLTNNFESSIYGEIYPYIEEQSYGFADTFCVDVSSSTLPTSAAITTECFETEYERECYISGLDNSLVYPISSYTTQVYGELFKTWNRDNDLIDIRSETVGGYWSTVFDGNLEYTLDKEHIVGRTLLGSSVTGGINESGINGITAFINVTSGGDFTYSYDYPRYYPLNDGLYDDLISNDFDVDNSIVGQNVPVIDLDTEDRNSFRKYLFTYDDIGFDENDFLPDDASLDKILNVNEWFSLRKSKLGQFYRDVLETIVEVKSSNRYKGEKQTLESDASPFNLNNWFDGFYSGKQKPLIDLYTFPSHRLKIVGDELEVITDRSDAKSDYLVSNQDYTSSIWELNTGGNIAMVNNFFENDDLSIRIFPGNLSTYETLFIVDMNITHATAVEWYIEQGQITVYGSNDWNGTTGTFEELFVMDGRGQSYNRYGFRYYKFVDTHVLVDEIKVRYVYFYQNDIDFSNLNKRYVQFGRYYGNPWGDQNSRKQYIEQIKSTLDGKFEDYDLYYGDLTNLVSADKNIELGEESNFWDKTLYPTQQCSVTDPFNETGLMGVSGTDTFLILNNPYVDSRLSLYKFNQDVIVNGSLIFSNEDLSGLTDTNQTYYKKNALAVDLQYTTVDVRGVVRPLVIGRNIMWNYNNYYYIKPELLKHIPVNSVISVEYEYTMNNLVENRNVPRRISQRVVLGRVNGDANQKFINPEKIISQENVTLHNIHRIWIDNVKVSDFDIVQVGNNEYAIEMKIPPVFEKEKQVGVIYREDNYYELKNTNKFLQKFTSNDDVPWYWSVFTRDENGYVKKQNSFSGFVVDENKFENDVVFHLDNITKTQIKTSDVAFGGEMIKPLQYGYDFEDVIQLNSLKRKNNFILTFDFIYDESIEREFMRFDVLFKGQFVNIKGKQYLSNYYSLVFGLDKGISLISRQLTNTGSVNEIVLAQIQDISAILKRGEFYTVKLKVIKNNVQVFFNKRNGEEKYFIGTNLQLGHEASNVELVAENKFNGLNVVYNNPQYFIDGDRIALKTNSSKINFTNFSVDFLDPDNITLGNPFVVKNYDTIVGDLKNKFNIEGDLVSIKKINTGYEYVQIGNSILSRKNDSQFVLHNMHVEKFEVKNDKSFIQEKISSIAPMTVINVYEKGFKLVQNIVVNGKQLVDEPLVAFLAVANKKATNIEKIDGKLFYTIDDITEIEDDWSNMTADWEEYYAPWNLY